MSTILRMYCNQNWQVRNDKRYPPSIGNIGSGSADSHSYIHGSQVLDWLWQRLREHPTWHIWMESWHAPGADKPLPVICLSNDKAAVVHVSTVLNKTLEFMAVDQSRLDAYYAIQPHIMMMGPL